MTAQFTCEQCGSVFEKHWRGRSVRRFCSVTCRNRFLAAHYWPPEKPRKMKVCPHCGHVGYRGRAECGRCNTDYRFGRKYTSRDVSDRLWTPEQVAYLREHYASDGAATVAEALGYSLEQVRNKANTIGLRLDAPARRRIIHDKASTHMSRHNPMTRAESVAKVKAWREAHPEVVAAIHAQLMAGQQRIQRDRPSKLEHRLRAILTELGVVFEPSALIKPRFIVDIRIDSLIIQADGDYWHGHPRFAPFTPRQLAQQRRDVAQDAYLRSCGYTVVRIWESEMGRDKVATILREHGLITST